MSERIQTAKSAEAYRTIGEAAEELKLPQHVLRFWETRFPHIKPLKRAGGRRFYRPDDVALLRAIKALLYGDGYTIKGVQRLLQEQGPRAVAGAAGLAQGGAGGGAYASLPAAAEGQGSTAWDGEGDLAPVRPLRALQPAPGETLPPAAPSPVVTMAASPDTDGREARTMPSSGIAARLEAVAFDLKECERLLAAARFPGA